MPGPFSSLSYWFDSLDEPVTPRPHLPGDLDVDVAIVGGGYTGLWTARYLRQADPALRVAVLEKEVAGFGASGRNGGWCSALFATSDASLDRRTHGRQAMLAMRRAMQGAVDEVGRASAEDGVDCHFAKGGTVTLARSEAQLERLREEVEAARALGSTEEDIRLLPPDEAGRAVGASNVLGGTFTPHCAAIHPARLARGLAEAVERRGAAVYERTPVLAIRPGRCVTPYGDVRAEVVVRATEAYTARLPGYRRTLAPVYSLMLATAPLPPAVWEEIGLEGRPTFSDARHMVIYGQRTADGRLAFGGRGAPYHFGSGIRPGYDRLTGVHEDIHRTLVELFPVLAGAEITHHWGGPLGVPRDWMPSVGLDRAAGLAWAGGYVGDGVSTTNLAGRTLADLILDRDTDLTRLPWVGHRSPAWEPEPLRWLGINAGLVATGAADASEARSGKPSHLARMLHEKLGG